MLDPHKPKYFPLYWDIVNAVAKQSVAHRDQVGAVVVTPTGMISVGWNGQPPSLDNTCEDLIGGELKTKSTVIHAERNALKKMTRQGVPVEGSLVFVSRVPCIGCAVALSGLGIKAVYYLRAHDDLSGAQLLEDTGTHVYRAIHGDPLYRRHARN